MDRRSFLRSAKLAAGAALIPAVAVATRQDTEVRYVPEEFDRVQTQLAGCLMASEGSLETRKVKRGDYAWSLALDRIHELWDGLATMQTRVSNLREMKDVVCAPGSVGRLSEAQASPEPWDKADYDHYSLGIANGIILALAILDDEAPSCVKAPKEWGRDRPVPEGLAVGE